MVNIVLEKNARSFHSYIYIYIYIFVCVCVWRGLGRVVFYSFRLGILYISLFTMPRRRPIQNGLFLKLYMQMDSLPFPTIISCSLFHVELDFEHDLPIIQVVLTIQMMRRNQRLERLSRGLILEDLHNIIGLYLM